MKNIGIILGSVLIILIVVVIGIRFASGEDNWICKDGECVKHGNPSTECPCRK